METNAERRPGRLERRAAEEHVRRLVDAAPPLSAEQRDRLAVILRGGAAGSEDADAVASAGKRQRRAS